jgi:N-acetylglucosaminyl-diphospho-decaprenol L-rhamnosyltransferase
MTNYDLAVVIVSYNTKHLLPEMFGALREALKNLTAQIIVIDNASVDGSYEFLKSNYPDVVLIGNSDNVGFGRANNQALPYVQSRYLLLLNTDAFVSPDTLQKTISYMDSKPKCGVLGVRLTGRLDELQPSCRYFPTPWNLFLHRTGLGRFFSKVQMVDDMQWDHASVRLCDWVTGCFYLVRREVIEQVGLFDPRYFLYYEEVDHCFAVKNAGWEIHYYPYTSVIHIGGESAKTEGELTAGGRQLKALQLESELLYFRKNHGLVTVIGGVVLSMLGDIICSLKIILKRDPPSEAAEILKNSVLVGKLLVCTRFGSRPTR